MKCEIAIVKSITNKIYGKIKHHGGNNQSLMHGIVIKDHFEKKSKHFLAQIH